MRYVLIALALAGCKPFLAQQSVAPPGRAARLDAVESFWGLKHYRLEISKGVALALTCELGGPCEKMIVVSENPAVAEVRPASLAALQQTFGYMQQPMSAFVIVGKSPGATKVRVQVHEGTRDLVVTVVAPPPGHAR